MRRRKIMIIAVVVALIIITIGGTFAYFTAVLQGTESSTTINVGGATLSLTVNGGNNIVVENIIPDDDAVLTKTITLNSINTSDLNMNYTLDLVIDSNTFASGSITYTLNSTNNDDNGVIIPEVTANQNIISGPNTINLGDAYFVKGTNKVHTYVIKLYFLDTAENQNNEQGKTLTAHIDIAAA